jgi:hypothetical protein
LSDAVRVLGLVNEALRSEHTTSVQMFSVGAHGRLRWLLPDNRRVARTVMESWRPHARLSRLAWWALTKLVSTFGPRLSPGFGRAGVLVIPQELASACDRLSCSEELVPAMYVGTPGPCQKTVCFLSSLDGGVEAVIKVPLTGEARKAVAKEAAILRALEAHLPQGTVPRLIAQQLPEITAQTWLDGTTDGRVFAHEHAEFLSLLVKDGSQTLLARLERIEGELGTPVRSYLAAAEYQQLASVLDLQAVFPMVLQHGDFAPWNLRRSAGHLCAVDWEDGDECGLPVWDIAHHFCVQAFLFNDGVKTYERMQANLGYRHYRSKLELTERDGQQLFLFYCFAMSAQAAQRSNGDFRDFLVRCALACQGGQ